MKPPKETSYYSLKRILPFFEAPLARVLERATLGGQIQYDSRTDEIIYHWVITDEDKVEFPLVLGEVDEVWIFQHAGTFQ